MKVKEISLSNRMTGETINKAQYMADINLTLRGMILPHSKHSESPLQKTNGLKLNRTRIGIYRENHTEHM